MPAPSTMASVRAILVLVTGGNPWTSHEYKVPWPRQPLCFGLAGVAAQGCRLSPRVLGDRPDWALAIGGLDAPPAACGPVHSVSRFRSAGRGGTRGRRG